MGRSAPALSRLHRAVLRGISIAQLVMVSSFNGPAHRGIFEDIMEWGEEKRAVLDSAWQLPGGWEGEAPDRYVEKF